MWCRTLVRIAPVKLMAVYRSTSQYPIRARQAFSAYCNVKEHCIYSRYYR